MTTNQESPASAFKSDNETSDTIVSTKVNPRRVSILGTGKSGEPPCVKREAVSPKSKAPTAYPVSVIENTMTRLSESETREMQTPSDQMTLSRERRNFLLPPALAVSLYSQHMRNQSGRGVAWNPLISPVVGGLHGFGLTHSLGLPQVSSAIINEQHDDSQKGMTVQPEQATKMACVTDESAIGTAVSKRKQHIETCFSARGEPLDLSQPEDEDTTVRVAGDDRVNMLLEGKMDGDDESREGDIDVEASQVHDLDAAQRKVKKEVVEDKAESVIANKQHTAARISIQEKVPEQNRNLSQNFFQGAPNMMAFMNQWLNFPAVLGPRTHFLPQGYSYIPTALPANPAHALSGLDPAAVGLSQWVNLSMSMARAADSMRFAAKPDRNGKNERKRKTSGVTSETEAAQIGQNENDTTRTETSTNHHSGSSAIEAPNKRCRLSDSNEGLHRSVSDDPGKRRQDESCGQKTKLRRRNSAPSTAAASDSDKESDKKSGPVDLRSYAGCLPPQCLHLLKASGNFSSLGESNGHGRIGSTDPSDTTDDTARSGSLSNPTSIAHRNGVNQHTDQDDSRRRSYPTNHELLRRKARKTVSENSMGGKVTIDAPVPILPRTSYFTSPNHQAYLQHYLFQKSPTVLPFVQNSRPFQNCHQRKRYESTSDDDDEHIETLQISDASSDEEDDTDLAQGKVHANMKCPPKQTSKLAESIGFGKGPWADLDNGTLTAFSSFTTVSTSMSSEKQSLHVPTKMACTVSKAFPQALNGLTRIQAASNIFKPDKRTEKPQIMLTAEEFRPHCEVTGPANEFSAELLLKLPTAATPVLKNKQNSSSRSIISSKTKQSEQKLIGDIFQKSFRNPNFHRHNTTSPRCVPRLVFTSELKTPARIVVGKEKKYGSNTDFDSSRSKAAITELRHTEIPQTSEPEYSHKLFSFARAATAKEGEHNNSDSVRSIVDQGSSSTVNERKKSAIFSKSVLPFQPAVSRVRGSSTSSRTGSLDAKIGELRQKATERQGQKTEANESRNNSDTDSVNNTKMQTAAESMQFAPSPPLKSGLDSRYRSTGSPFYDSDVGRFGKRNIAVIKPNQSVLDGCEKKTPSSTCPPKKRHMKRYSPEFYSKPKADHSVHDREVRSASPIPHPPFVSTNVLINNDEHSLNVRWCSPDRSPNRRTILTLRGPNSHTVTLERNLRKYPRHVPANQSDAVIVVRSGMVRRPLDETDQRLEIEDLEISDEETQMQ